MSMQTSTVSQMSTAGASDTTARSHRPHSRPKQHTDEWIKLILNMRRRNPNTGIVVFWVKLRQRGYAMSISGLYRAVATKLPKPQVYAKALWTDAISRTASANRC